jgi:hypothetical protein
MRQNVLSGAKCPEKSCRHTPLFFLFAKVFPSAIAGEKVTILCHRLLIEDFSMFQDIILKRENQIFHAVFEVVTGGTKTALSIPGGFQDTGLFGILFIGK